jgi:hypothetical protein
MKATGPAKRIGLFAIGLLFVFGAAAAVGSLVEPTETESEAPHGAEESEKTEETMEVHTAHQATPEPAGLGVSEDGYTLRMSPTQLHRGEARELRFSIDTSGGEPVTEFDQLHERRMHLIVVRRDGSEFRHLHPEMDEAGTWSIPITFHQPGVYRAFADFSVGGEQHTLASDIFISGGEFEARPFPPANPLYMTDGYEVRLETGNPVAGEPTSLNFTVSRDGAEVAVAPYLGAKGHLVALREGDLAFLHVHPEEAEMPEPAAEAGHGAHGAHGGHQGAGAPSNEIAFAATFPTAGRYRLYLQFKHEGAVKTAQFTVVVPR